MSYSKIEGDDYPAHHDSVELYPRLPERKHDDEDIPVPSAPQEDDAPQPSAPPQTDEDQYSTSYSQVYTSDPVSYPEHDNAAPRPFIPVAIPVQAPSNPVPQAGIPSNGHYLPVQLMPVIPPVPTELELHDRIWGRQSEFQMSRYIHEAWMFLKPNFCIFVLAQIVSGLIILGYVMINLMILHRIAPLPPRDSSREEWDREIEMGPSPYIRMLVYIVSVLLFSSLIAYPMACSWFTAVFNAMRTNSHVLFRDFFSSFSCNHYFRTAGLGFFLALFHSLLSMLWFFPGVWFSMITMFAVPLRREHKFLGICQSMRFSARVIHRHFCSVLGFLLCLALLQVIGFFCLIVGLLVTLPLSHISLCYAYHYLIGVNGVTIYVPQNMQQAVVQPVQVRRV